MGDSPAHSLAPPCSELKKVVGYPSINGLGSAQIAAIFQAHKPAKRPNHPDRPRRHPRLHLSTLWNLPRVLSADSRFGYVRRLGFLGEEIFGKYTNQEYIKDIREYAAGSVHLLTNIDPDIQNKDCISPIAERIHE